MKIEIDITSRVESLLAKGETGVVPIEVGDCYGSIYYLLNLDTKQFVSTRGFSFVAHEFVCDLAVVRDGEKYGVVKKDGTFLIEPNEGYECISIHESGVIILDRKDETSELISVKTLLPLTDIEISSVEDPITVTIDDQDFTLYKVVVKELVKFNTYEYFFGVIRSDGVWLAKPIYREIKIYDECLLARRWGEDEFEHGILVNIKTAEVIAKGERLYRFGEWPGVYAYYEEDNQPKVISVKDGKVDITLSGHRCYREFMHGKKPSWITCMKGTDRDDIFCLAKKEYILKDIEDMDNFKERAKPGEETYIFKKNGLYGILSNEGEILLDAIATYISHNMHIGADIRNHQVIINGLAGIWNSNIRGWVVLPQWTSIVYEHSEKVYLVSNFEKCGVMRSRKIYRILDLNGKPVSEDTFLNIEDFNSEGYAVAKRCQDRRRIVINAKGEEVVLPKEK